MTKKMGLMALGLSMALLSGCGSSNDTDGDTDGDVALNIPTEVERNIVGSWDEGCDEEYGDYATSTLLFEADGTGEFIGTEYDNAECTGDAIGGWNGTFTYVVGAATVGAGGEDAVELDIVVTENGNTMNYYTMAHFISINSWIMADDEDENSEADTPETREDIFEGGDVLIRQ